MTIYRNRLSTVNRVCWQSGLQTYAESQCPDGLCVEEFTLLCSVYSLYALQIHRIINDVFGFCVIKHKRIDEHI